MPPSQTRKNDVILIIGAGIFGLTLSLELHQRGYTNITILDRYVPPVPDGSSVDISRVIRPDYADAFYAKLGLEAMEGWNSSPHKRFFHQSGLLSVSQTQDHPYIRGSRRNLEDMGLSVERCDEPLVRRKCRGFSPQVQQLDGYFNSTCGWVDAGESINMLARRCSEAGIGFISGARGTVVSLITLEKGRKVAGVRTQLGVSVFGDHVVVATGAWTPYLIDMSGTSISTGQPVAFLQLTKEEAEELRDAPVIIDMSTGWFCFPPTPETNMLKMARHGYGYETSRALNAQQSNASTCISAPCLHTNNANASYLPEDAEQALRAGLKLVFPNLAKRDFSRQRLCWYTDTVTGDFIVDNHPAYENVFVATGGSGQ